MSSLVELSLPITAAEKNLTAITQWPKDKQKVDGRKQATGPQSPHSNLIKALMYLFRCKINFFTGFHSISSTNS